VTAVSTRWSTSQRPLTLVAAALVLAGGIWHLKLWDDRYRDLPDQIPGVEVVKLGFPVNAAVSVVLAGLLLVAGGRLAVLAAAMALEAGSIFALVDARTTVVLGWEDKTWDDDAVGILVLEAVALALLAFLAWRSRRTTLRP